MVHSNGSNAAYPRDYEVLPFCSQTKQHLRSIRFDWQRRQGSHVRLWQGLYVWTEAVRRGDDRVAIEKHKGSSVDSGGYMLKE